MGGSQLKVYRIYRAHLRDRAFTGEGARIHGARWNLPGRPVVYAGSSISLCTLEMLVHWPGFSFHHPSVSLEVRGAVIPDSIPVRPITPAELPANWNAFPYPESTQKWGTDLLRQGKYLVVAVPSVLVPTEQNYLIDPLHPDFRKLTLGKPLPYPVNRRLAEVFLRLARKK